MPELRVLMVEDNLGDIRLVQGMLQTELDEHFTLEHSQKLELALEKIRSQTYDVILLDLTLPDSGGYNTFIRVLEAARHIPIILLTGLADEAMAEKAVGEGAQDYLIKGQIESLDLVRSIRYAIERKKAEREIENSEARYRKLFETARYAILIADAKTGQVTDVNSFTEELIGYRRSDFLDKPFNQTPVFSQNHLMVRAFEELQTKKVFEYGDYILKSRDGKTIAVELIGNVYFNDQQRIIQCNFRDITERKLAEGALQKSHQELEKLVKERTLELIAANERLEKDISERKKAEKQLRESEERFRNVFLEAPIGIALLSMDLKFVKANKALCSVMESGEDEIKNRTLMEATVSEDAQKESQLLADLIADKISVYRMELRFKTKKMSSVWVNTTASLIRDEEQRPVYLLLMVENIDTQKKTAKALGISRRIVEAQEEERRWLARELHDSVNQILSSINLRIQSAESRMKKRDTGVSRDINASKLLLEKAISEIRRISHNLRPIVLADLGLAAAARSLCDEFGDRSQIDITFVHESFPAALPSDIELALYRILQESLNNVVKHAKADKVWIELAKEKEDSFVRLTIRDNGKGFDQKAAAQKSARGLGLIHIRERAEFIGGSVDIQSKLRRGVRITVRVPMERRARSRA